MAITKSAKKEIRASKRKHVFNLRRSRTMKNLMKQTIAKFKSGDTEGARADFVLAQKAIDKSAKRGIIKERTASRKKSFLARAIKPNS